MALTQHQILLLAAAASGCLVAFGVIFFCCWLIRRCRRLGQRQEGGKPDSLNKQWNDFNRGNKRRYEPVLAKPAKYDTDETDSDTARRPASRKLGTATRPKQSNTPATSSGYFPRTPKSTSMPYPSYRLDFTESRHVTTRDDQHALASSPNYPTNIQGESESDVDRRAQRVSVMFPQSLDPRHTARHNQRRGGVSTRHRKTSRSAPASRGASPTRMNDFGMPVMSNLLINALQQQAKKVSAGEEIPAISIANRQKFSSMSAWPTASSHDESSDGSTVPASMETRPRDIILDTAPFFPLSDAPLVACPNGRLNFRVRYMAADRIMEVSIFSAEQLPEHVRDPFVKVKILKQSKRTFSVTSKHSASTLTKMEGLSKSTPELTSRGCSRSETGMNCDARNPRFAQILKFYGIDISQLRLAQLRLSARDHGRYTDKRLGEVLLATHDLNLGIEWKEFTMSLEKNPKFVAQPGSPRGEIAIGLRFVDAGSKLRCRILKLMNLPRSSSNNCYGVYVNIRLMRGEFQLEKQKTTCSSCYDSAHVLLNFPVEFDLQHAPHHSIHLVLEVKALVSTFGRKSLEIGRILLGSSSSDDEARQQWRDAEYEDEAIHTHRLHS